MINLIKQALRYLAYKTYDIFHKVVVIGKLYEYDISTILPEYSPKIEGRFTVLDSAGLKNFKDKISSGKYSLFEDRITKNKDIMLAFLVNGELAYWAWIRNGKRYYEPFLAQEIRIPHDAAYIYDTVTAVKYRRKGIHSAAFGELLKLIKELGKKKALILILDQNKPALQNLKKFNFRYIQKIILINIAISKLTFRIKK